MKSIIVDDEYRGREVLAALLKAHCPEITISAMAGNVATAEEMIRKFKPDLVFLDIEMPDGTGFDLLQQFGEPTFKTVFVTSYNEYAIQAIRAQAFDYLLKPVIVDELKSTVDQLLKQQNALKEKQQLQDVLEINFKTRLDYIRIDEILWLKGDGNYTFIYTVNGKSYHTSRILRDYEQILCRPDSGFVRVHKGAIINLKHVKTFEHGAVHGLVLVNGLTVEVSRRKKEEVLAQMRIYRAMAGKGER